MNVSPSIREIREGNHCTIVLAGSWSIYGTKNSDSAAIPEADRIVVRLQEQKADAVILKNGGISAWDSSLISICLKIIRACDSLGISADDSDLPDGVRSLLRLALAVPPRKDAEHARNKIRILERLGHAVLRIPEISRNTLEFLGETTLAVRRLITGRSACTAESIWSCLHEAGSSSLPIVSLISLLVGLILAFVGVIQLKMFGAQVYTASLVAIGMTRIMGAIMTGIIVAGRTGASYAAVIGTMQVNEEIDALRTLGISPADALVLPRVLALTCMTPLLVIYADFCGMLGGFLVGVGVLGLNPVEYMTFTQKGFMFINLGVGVFHGAVFGFIIAMTGCYQGLKCGRNAEAVGLATTSSVVYSIVGIVLATSIITVICNILQI
ncbi:MAG: ABC transporter permease [Desulfovibrionaceae bacterium]|nr:ABC transporter permease [Desulfovibrionaceae bacterium]